MCNDVSMCLPQKTRESGRCLFIYIFFHLCYLFIYIFFLCSLLVTCYTRLGRPQLLVWALIWLARRSCSPHYEHVAIDANSCWQVYYSTAKRENSPIGMCNLRLSDKKKKKSPCQRRLHVTSVWRLPSRVESVNRSEHVELRCLVSPSQRDF